MSEKEVPMIPKHQAEKQMMHMSWTIRWLVVAIVIGFLCMVGMSYIFVTGYTSRTKEVLLTVQQLTEAKHEKEETGAVQQLPLP